MQNLLYDFIPVLLFFISFKLYGIYVATVVGIVATALQVLFTAIFKARYDKQQVITLAVFVVFGGMTLYFHNPLFIKWKPTIVFWIFSLVFFVTQFFTKKTLIQQMLEKLLEDQTINIPSGLWKRLNLVWMLFFLILGSVNLYIAYHYSTDFWVNFKVYGITVIILLFSVAQALLLSKYMADK